jgi:regulatory protein
MTPAENPAQALYTAALELLSRREHSCLELRRKLADRFPDADFDALLSRLQELNYQSDRRFAEIFTRSRIQRGQGPLRIRRDLQQRGIGNELILNALEQQNADWYQLAAEQLERKFRAPISAALPRDQQLRERARRQRYLAYRGFPTDAVMAAVDNQAFASD